MKIAIAGLSSLLLWSCAAGPTRLSDSEMNAVYKLQSLNADSRLQFDQERELYTFKPATGLDGELSVKNFEDKKQAALYLQNRKMLLHQYFQNNIAPYFGVIELDKTCLDLADTKAFEIRFEPSAKYFTIQLPVNKQKAISECVGSDAHGVVKYIFVNCENSLKVFEFKLHRNLIEKDYMPQLNCQ